MKKPTTIIPALLSSKGMRDQLSHRKEPAFAAAAGAIDAQRKLFEALKTLHETPSPNITKEARALRYAKQLETARKSALSNATNAMQQLDALEAGLREAAFKNAKLDVRLSPFEESEIRAALRSLSDEERTAAIIRAAETGDATTLNAVRFAPSPLTVGTHTAPIDTLVDTLLHNANPTLRDDLNDIEQAAQHVSLATEAFAKHTNEMRDPVLESQGEAQAAKLREAETALAGQ